MKLENRDLSIGTGGDGHTRQESGEVKVWEGGGDGAIKELGRTNQSKACTMMSWASLSTNLEKE